jgi:hypothetical protein
MPNLMPANIIWLVARRSDDLVVDYVDGAEHLGHLPCGSVQAQNAATEAIRLMGIAFEMALVALQRTDGIVNPTRDAVAQKIIDLAKAGERDPERLCAAALQALRPSPRVIISDPSPLPPLASPQERLDS